MLHGRGEELSVVDRLLGDCRAGRSGLVTGEPGIGKTALLEHAASKATDLRVLRGTGIESEAHLPFAGLHLLLRSALDRIDAAARTRFGEPQETILVGATSLHVAGHHAGSYRVAGELLARCREQGWIGRTPPVLACLACPGRTGRWPCSTSATPAGRPASPA